MKAFIIICICWMSWRSFWTFVGLGINAYPFKHDHTAGKAVLKLIISLGFIAWGLYLVVL